LYTYFHVGEDKQDLYGFLSAVDRDFFELLLTVSGVGPKVALSILSSHDTNILRSAIAENRPEIFASASGVGKKTAERIIVDLKSKIGIQPDLASDYGQTFEALRSLGYTANEAKQALAAVPKGVTDSAEQIRLALKALAK
jgi:holliday junction DNA helicase RuvA